jgi:YD repeat-containing protein
VGNLTKVIDPKGAVTKTEYDNANRPTKIFHPAVFFNNGNVLKKTLMDYDRNGNVRLLTNPAGAVTRNTYNTFNKLETSTQFLGTGAAGRKLNVTRTYDNVGNVRSVTDGKLIRPCLPGQTG